MRVVYAGPPTVPEVTGGHRYTNAMLSALEREEGPVHVLPRPRISRLQRRLGYATYLLGQVHYLRQYRAVRELSPDVLLGEYSESKRLLPLHLLLSQRRDLKVIAVVQVIYYTYRGQPVKDWLDRQLTRLFLRTSAGVMVNSRAIAKEVTALGVPQARVRVVYPPIPAAIVASAPTTFDRRRDDHGRCRLLCVSYVTPRKGLHILVEALSLVEPGLVELMVVGDTESSAPRYARRLREMVEAFRLGDRVRFPGRLPPEQVAEHYRSSDVLVLPSLEEGFGMVLAESQCFGLPAIASRVGGIPEVVEDGVTGLLVPPGDVAALAEGITRLARDSELRWRLGKQAFERSWRLGRRTEQAMGHEAVTAIRELAALP